MADSPDSLDAFCQFAALERGVLVVSVAMFAFSLAFQMTSRYIPEYLTALSTLGFLVWWAAPVFATPALPAWLWIFAGLFLMEA